MLECLANRKRTLSHNNTAHENLDWSNAFKRDLALACCLVQTKLVSEFVFADSVGMIDFVSKNQERYLGQILHGQESVKLRLRLREALTILCIDQEDDARHLREVVLP
jgi:hypothetical protein